MTPPKPDHAITYDSRAIIYRDTLIIADLHLGRTDVDELQYPTPEYDEIITRFRSLLDAHQPSNTILAGDVFQQFSQPPEEAVDTLDELAAIARNKSSELTVLPGNHDTYKFDIGRYYSGQVRREFEVGEAVVHHGHQEPEASADLNIVGHLHPVLNDRGNEWPCFLYAESAYENSDVLVLPAFADTVGGVPVRNMTPPVNVTMPVVENGKNIRQYRPLVYDDEKGDVRVFPRINDF